MKKRKHFGCVGAILAGMCLIWIGSGCAKQEGTVLDSWESDFPVSERSFEDSEYERDSNDAESPGKNDPEPGGAEKEESAEEESPGENRAPDTSLSGQTSGSRSTALKVTGTRLTDAMGNPVVLKGISTHGISWFPEYVNEDSIKQLHDQWGADCIRLAMYTAEYNGYCTGGEENRERLKKLIDDGVRYATENEMYVVIDWHILSDGNPNTHLEQAKEFFSEVAEKYAGHSNVLYEICNEPNGGTSWGQIKSYAEQIIPIIRKMDKDAIIIVGTPNWCQYLKQAAADPIMGFDNIMYALHFYAGTHTDSLRREMIAAIQSGLPVFVTEFGICDASGSGGIDGIQAEKWLDLLDQYGISRIVWNLSNKNETSALISAGCQKESGWTYEELSDSGKWLYKNMFHRSASGSSGNPPPKEEKPDSSEPEVPSEERLENAVYELAVVNSWETDGKTYSQYAVTILNDRRKQCNGWTVTIVFDDPMTITASWNGDFSLRGNTITIRSLDYNGRIEAGGRVDGIGFIAHD